MIRLDRNFYYQPTLQMARDLLGKRLVRVLNGQRLSGLIVETEVYIGEADKACHASRGRTPRTEVMYGPPGHAYIYFIYGMHHCFNVVTEEEGFPAAVLIRALEPLEGLEWMRRHRPGRPDGQLTNGPGKLCAALAIDRTLNGMDLCTSQVFFIEEGRTVAGEEIATSPRIGIRSDEVARSRPWRFYIKGNSCVSR
ncbi:MAG: DNA-3-methyladenine glycosylase [Anaerolineales bacterium]|nr:MAG: DNA-3-methyladenine glycosylase [Anaerolineales bacterium]